MDNQVLEASSLTSSTKILYEKIVYKAISPPEEAEISPFEEIWLKAFISISPKALLQIIDPKSFQLQAKLPILAGWFKGVKAFDRKNEGRVILTLGVLGKLLRGNEDLIIPFEIIQEFNNLALRLLKKNIKSNKFGFKTVALLTLIFSIEGFLSFKPQNLDKIDLPSLLKLLLESSLDSLEKHPLFKLKRLFLFLQEFLRDLKGDKSKKDLIEVFLSFYFKFLGLQIKSLHSHEKKESFKPASTTMIQIGESFKGIFPEETRKAQTRLYGDFKDLFLWTIIRAFGLDWDTDNDEQNSGSSPKGVNFIMVFSKLCLDKLLASETMNMGINSESNSHVLNPIVLNPLKETFEEKAVFSFLQELLKRNERPEFRSFLFETVNSKLKLRNKGNIGVSMKGWRLLSRFNIKAAILIEDQDTFRKVMFELLGKFDESEDEDLKGYILGLIQKAIRKVSDKGKLSYILTQESMRFCKVKK